MGKLTKQQDAFGQFLYDHLAGDTRGADIERDDGRWFVELNIARIVATKDRDGESERNEKKS